MIFYINKLLPKSIQNSLLIRVNVVEIVGARDDVHGTCISSSSFLNEFTIIISSKVKFHEKVQVLAHECVHLSQYVSGKLAHKGNNVIWDGKDFGNFSKLHASDEYNSFPWELAAYQQQESLFMSFADWLEAQDLIESPQKEK